MFYGQCWKCGERWELGTASTCKCPEETTIEWTEVKLPSPVLTLSGIKPNYNMMFHRDGKQVGALDFNGPEMTFTGDVDESAKLFFNWIALSFKARLEQERADERNSWPAEMEAMERQVNILTDALAEAVEAEREACAKVCEELLERPSGYQGTWEGYGKFKTQMTGQECAAAIRARSNT